MTKLQVTRLLIEILAPIKVNELLPPIKQMTVMFNCSRGVIQTCLKELEDNQAIGLTRGKVGTRIISKNVIILHNIYFDNNLIISLPMSTLNVHKDSNLTADILNSKLFNVNPLFTYSDSSLERIDKLVKGDVNLAVISDIYLNNLDDKNIQSIYAYTNNDKQPNILRDSTDPSLSYSIEEVPSKSTDDDSYIANSYHLVITKPIKNILLI